jgi:predicted ATPase
MRITGVSVENFRCFEKFAIDLKGESRFLIGENAIGKSSLMTAMARALGKERTFQRTDFLDLKKAIDIRVAIRDLDGAQLGVFPHAADFGAGGAPTTLTVGVRVAWDPDAEECEIEHGYPTKNWIKSKPVEREAIDVHWIPDTREASRLLQFGVRRSLLSDVLSKVDLDAPIAQAISDIQKASTQFAAAKDLASLLKEAGKQLAQLVPSVGADPYSIESTASTDLSVLRQLQLALEHAGPRLPIGSQSSGLAQLTLFSFSLLSIMQKPGAILLVDEPELSLHAHCQRALLRLLRALPNQFLLGTHSASLLDRADPRQVARLHRDGKIIREARPSTLKDAEVRDLTRYMTADNAEAFFARKAVLVEGLSDKYAIEALAERKGRNLDAEGVSVVAMKGCGLIGTFLSLLGSKGLGVRLVGMCDGPEDEQWAKSLEEHGFGKGMDRAAMAKVGFFVCDKDLEDVLVTAVGDAQALKILDGQGEKPAFDSYVKQPAHAGKSQHEQICDFLHSRGRHIRYAPLLVDELDLTKTPPALEGVVNAI